MLYLMSFSKRKLLICSIYPVATDAHNIVKYTVRGIGMLFVRFPSIELTQNLWYLNLQLLLQFMW